MASDLKSLKIQFLEYLEIEKGRSVKTVENYDRYLMRFLEYAKVSSPKQITEKNYFLEIINARELCKL